MVKRVPSESRTFSFASSGLTLTFGSIVDSKAEALISSDDAYITMGGGVSASILQAGGDEIHRDAAKNAPAQVGDVIVTTAGRLPAKHMFHAITMGDMNLSLVAIVRKTVSKCFDLLNLLGLRLLPFQP